MNRVIIVLSVVAALLAPGPAHADGGCAPRIATGGDWPMLSADLLGTNSQPAEDLIGPDSVAGLQPIWTTGTNTGSQTVPIVSGGCVYITHDRTVDALDIDTGGLVWRTEAPVDGGQTFAVSVTDGRLHLNTPNRQAPKALAFDPDTGAHLWTSEEILFGYRANQLSSAMVFDGIHVMHTTGPDFDPQARPGYALFEAATGATLHKQTTIRPEQLDDGFAGGGVWGTPSVDPVSKHAFVGTANPYSKTKEHRYDNAILKIDLDRSRTTFGTIVDAFKGESDTIVDGLYNQPVCQTAGDQVNTPFVNPPCAQQDVDFGNGPTLWTNRFGERMLAQIQKTGVMHALFADSMQRAWSIAIGTNSTLTATGGNHAQAANDGETIYLNANPGVLWALDGETGAIRWVAPHTFPIQGNNVAVANGVVYTVDTIGIRAWDTATGSRLWEYLTFTGGQFCMPTGSGISIARHTLVANCGGVLFAFRLPS